MMPLEASTPLQPEGCIGLAAKIEQGRWLIAERKAQYPRLLLLQNKSKNGVWLRLGDSLSTQTDAGNNAILLQDNQALSLACVEIKPGSEQYVSCDLVLSVCAFNDVKPNKALSADQWITENSKLTDAMIYINAYGIELNDKT